MNQFLKAFDNPQFHERLLKAFYCVPIGKPRMTRRDIWKKRPAVVRYHEFKDTLALQRCGFDMPNSGIHIYFLLQMPSSWSNKNPVSSKVTTPIRL